MLGLLVLAAAEAALCRLLVVADRRGNQAAVANIAGAVLLLFVPPVVEMAIGGLDAVGRLFTPVLPLWLGAACVVHCLGMVGLYESVRGWDHLAHGLSAGLATALVYAALLTVGWPADNGWLPAVATLAVVVGAGVLWEVAEYTVRAFSDRLGVEPVLVVYGPRDTAMDLVFDLLGAALVLAADLRVFVSVFETLVG